MLLGDVACPADDGRASPIRRWSEASNRSNEASRPSSAERERSGPHAGLEQCRETSSRVLQRGRIDEIAKRPPDQILKWNSQNFRQPKVGYANFAFERHRKQRLVKVVDQLAVIMLRANDGFRELVNLRLRTAVDGTHFDGSPGRWVRWA